MKQLITITTDFGDHFAASQLEAVIFSLGFTGQIIENHDISSFSDVQPGQPLILNGSSDLLELAVNLHSAKDHFGLKLGQIIEYL